MLCLDFTLDEAMRAGGAPETKYFLWYDTKIGHNTKRKELTKEEYVKYQSLITKYPRLEMDIDGDNIKELVYQCTLNQIENGILPPVDVVALAPTKNGTNKKMLVVGLLVVVCVFVALATKPIKRKR